MIDKRNAILVFLIIGIIVSAIVISSDLPLTTSDNVLTLRTINQSNQTGNLNLILNNTSIGEIKNATSCDGIEENVKEGERSQNRLLYGGIISILVMQMIILVLIIQCRKHRTYILKPKSD